MHVEIRARGEKKKYYLAHSIRKGIKVKKISFYLGSDLSKTELAQKKKHAEAIILERIKSQKKLPKKPKYEIANTCEASKISDEAARLFIEEGYVCSEATFLAFAKRNGLDTAYAKAATGFGAGIGRKGSLCGALTGGVLALGLKHGRTSAKDNSSKEKTLELSGKYYDAFEKEFKAVACKHICGCDLSASEGRKKFKDDNVRREVCEKVVRRAAEILRDLDDCA